jgi:hypothetical protein
LVDVLAETGSTTSSSGSPPVDVYRDTVEASKSMPYAKLYHAPASSSTLQWDLPPAYQVREVPSEPPYFSSVKWLCAFVLA